LILHLCSAMYAIINSFLCRQRRQMSSPGYLRSRFNSLDLYIVYQELILF
jgi:hypothetical protein